jgi:hypothetical protein
MSIQQREMVLQEEEYDSLEFVRSIVWTNCTTDAFT